MEAELMEDSEEEDQLCVFVSKVEKGALAYLHGECVVQHVVPADINKPYLLDCNFSFLQT